MSESLYVGRLFAESAGLPWNQGYINYPINYTDSRAPKWWPGGVVAYAKYRAANPFNTAKDWIVIPKGYFLLSYANSKNGIGPENFLIMKSDKAIYTDIQARWINVFPGIHGKAGNLTVDKLFLSDFTASTLSSETIFIPTIYSLSHFLAESLPHLILSIHLGLVKSITVGYVLPWQKMLIEIIAGMNSLPIVYQHGNSDTPSCFGHLIHAGGAIYFKNITFFEGLAITSSYLSYIAGTLGLDKLVTINKQYESSRSTIPANAYGRPIYISRYLHETITKNNRPPRVFNYHEMVHAAIERSWFTLCPERYMFWSVYSLIASAKRIVCDNGSSQIHSLINQNFIGGLKSDGSAYLKTLVSENFAADANVGDSWMWWSSVLGLSNYDILCGKEEIGFEGLPTFMRPCVFDITCFDENV